VRADRISCRLLLEWILYVQENRKFVLLKNELLFVHGESLSFFTKMTLSSSKEAFLYITSEVKFYKHLEN
jgi:hypothetical protein